MADWSGEVTLSEVQIGKLTVVVSCDVYPAMTISIGNPDIQIVYLESASSFDSTITTGAEFIAGYFAGRSSRSQFTYEIQFIPADVAQPSTVSVTTGSGSAIVEASVTAVEA